MLVPLIFLAPACYFDYKEQRIPNEITYTMFVSGLIMQAIFGSLKEAFMGILILVVLLSFLSKVFQLGGGDIKLIIGCGAWLGKTSPYFLFFTLLFLLIYNCIALLRKLGYRTVLSKIIQEMLYGYTESLNSVPGAFFIAAGFVATLLYECIL